MSAIEDILKQCSGVRFEENEFSQWSGKVIRTYNFYKEGEIKVPDDIYIKITGTATKGTIGKVIGVDVETFGKTHPGAQSKDPCYIFTYDTSIIYECENRKKPGRIKASHVILLSGPQQTEYVRNINTRPKEEIKNPVNKFKQELQKGDWVIGVKPGKKLGIGRITRWTNHNVWAVRDAFNEEDLNDKSKEFRFDSIYETFTLPNDEHVELLTWAVLKGWKGD